MGRRRGGPDLDGKVLPRGDKVDIEAEAGLKAVNPQNRLIQPEEVAAAVSWLCSDGAGSITGQAISISGGEA